MAFSLRKYVYPDIQIPFAGRLHPDVDVITEEVRKWAFQHKLLENESDTEKFKQEQIVRLTGHSFPDGDYERTLLLAKFALHAFVLDDNIDAKKQGPFFDALMKHGRDNYNLAKILDQSKDDTETPIATAFADIWSQVKKLSNEEWQNRYAENFIWFIKANAWEENNRNCKRIPPLAEFLEYRHYTSSVAPTFNHIEISENIFIPDSVLVSPTLQRLIHIAGNIVAFENDVYSFEKERKVGEVNNLVIVLQHQFDISYQQAIDMAAEMVNEEVKKFLALEPLLPSFGIEMDKSVNKYVEGLRMCFSGHHGWITACARYPRFAYPSDQL